MKFTALAAGEAVFVDANIFVYHFAPDPILQSPCSQLFQRIENQEVSGFTSTAILSEVAHRLMTIEARIVLGWSPGKVGLRLKQQPSAIQRLTAFRAAVEVIVQSRIQVLSIAPDEVTAAAGLSQQCGLLSNDALLVAVMQSHRLTNLASHDSDFDRVPGISRWAPI